MCDEKDKKPGDSGGKKEDGSGEKEPASASSAEKENGTDRSAGKPPPIPAILEQLAGMIGGGSARVTEQLGGRLEGVMQAVSGMVKDMEKKKVEQRRREFSATAGGGMVKATVNGTLELISLKIDREVIDPDDPEMLQDLVIAAANSALAKAKSEQGGTGMPQMNEILGGFPFPPGLFEK